MSSYLSSRDTFMAIAETHVLHDIPILRASQARSIASSTQFARLTNMGRDRATSRTLDS